MEKKSENKISYSFVDTKRANIVFRSRVTSYNLEAVTDKDMVSFYTEFSKYSAFDTGLMPLDGTGVLSIRKAGPYTQVAYQYKPGSYYINWGSYEKDPNAKKYLLAQPYRIVVIDFKDGNLLGARTFYSTVPVTHYGVQLYHVNLPNINCMGYRGNGVGWICLYLNDDWSSLPFNERLGLALERCSGAESYNDQNMNETDGPTFYKQMYSSQSFISYLWTPQEWEQKTTNEGFEWTMDSENSPWIPIMVAGADSQDRHASTSDAVPLTFKMALTGKYKSYYSDTDLIKPINALQRTGGILPLSQIFDYFVKSYNSSDTNYSGIDSMSLSEEFRENRTDGVLDFSVNEYSEEPEESNEDEDEQEEPF